MKTVSSAVRTCYLLKTPLGRYYAGMQNYHPKLSHAMMAHPFYDIAQAEAVIKRYPDNKYKFTIVTSKR